MPRSEVGESNCHKQVTDEPFATYDDMCRLNAENHATLITARAKYHAALTLAKEATNALACVARRKYQYDEVMRLHTAIRNLESDGKY